ncbi:hypothetical protein TPB0596_32410 [Tsukamurella pulmonis]|uniref:hypothetical protein n=1 Tax=Tsukamurella pulmonis TaxID=47312 RepID=UPI001EDCEFD4|nr:hypothetical protein [Tsukamurella pulmonis]BDD83478.1 hypothetical protein TPB0596_32410 [Tsukamurella pulmonis]
MTVVMLAGLLLAEQAYADSGWDILARLVDNVGSIIGAIAAAIALIAVKRAGVRDEETKAAIEQRHEENRAAIQQVAESTEEIRESTVNSHEWPMRYDLDDLAAAVVSLHGTVATVASSVQELKGQVQELSDQQEDDRAARRAGDRGLAARVEEQERIARLRHPDDMP